MLQYQKNTFFSIILSVLLIYCVSPINNCGAQFARFHTASSYDSLCKTAGINPEIFKLAYSAHQKAYQQGLTKSALLTVIDYSKPSTEKRFWVVDLKKRKIIFHTHVAHGSGSGDVYARSFSNKPGSYKSSIGAFITGGTYYGRHGRSLNLIGLEKGINNNAYNRRIVIHAAHYVSEQFIKQHGRLGRSWGCPALSNKLAQPIINTIKDGVLLYAYFPEPYWLKYSSYS